MSQQTELNKEGPKKVFLSYSRSDRQRVTALCLFLETFGHTVFIDHLSIKPGMKWNDKIQSSLDEADLLVVFWTKYSAESSWVRKEYEYFQAQHRDRPIVPILGDETPLTESLSMRQHLDFCPLINELLELTRTLKAEGVSKRKIDTVIFKRLDEAGIKIVPRKRRKLMLLFGSTGIMGTFLFVLTSFFDKALDKLFQLSPVQITIVSTASALTIVGALTYSGDKSSYRYLGCYQDTGIRVLKGHSTSSGDSMTNAKCQSICSENNFIYAGTEYSRECFCGNTFSAKKVPEKECNYKCSGNDKETCGGFWRISVYQR